MIRLDSVKKVFGRQVAIEQVSFTLERGQVSAFLGQNGAGKSTTMRLISGLIAPDQGHLSFEDRPYTEVGQRVKARLGFLPENNPLYPDLSVIDHLEWRAALCVDPPNVQRAITGVVNDCRLAPVLKREARRLSKGFRQRLGLALALLGDPDVLLLDEPESGLDPDGVALLHQLIGQIARNRCILISTHHLEHVPRFADRVLMLHRGALVFDGPLDTFRGSQEWAIVVDRGAEVLGPLLDGLPFISRWRVLADQEDGFRFALSGSLDTAGRGQLSLALAKGGVALKELSRLHSPLRERFASLCEEAAS